jgi:nicotinate-nucleotide--dimethylbenzimidazole phosphoribosyltransferase
MGVDHDFGPAPGLVSRKIVRGTANIARGAAMTRKEAESCINAGTELAREYCGMGYKIFGTGDMGIGNTTPSSAIAAVLTGRSVPELTGKGTGIDDSALAHKIKVIEKALAVNAPDSGDGIDVLAKVGGAEIGGIAGLVLGAAALKIPVVVDGFISTAGALIAHSISPEVMDFIFVSHNSAEAGHAAMMERLGLSPILDLGLRLGEGTGAALAMHIVEASVKIYREMASFSEAGVSEKG